MPFNIENFANDYYIEVDSPEYVAIPAARKASAFDRNLLLMVETMRAKYHRLITDNFETKPANRILAHSGLTLYLYAS